MVGDLHLPHAGDPDVASAGRRTLGDLALQAQAHSRQFPSRDEPWMLAGLTRGICIPLAAVAMTYLWIHQGDKFESRCSPSRS